MSDASVRASALERRIQQCLSPFERSVTVRLGLVEERPRDERGRENSFRGERPRSVSRNRKARFLQGWDVKNRARRPGAGRVERLGFYTRALWHFASFKLQSRIVDTPGHTKQALARSLFHSAGRSKKREGGRGLAQRRKHARTVRRRRRRRGRRGLLPVNSLIAVSLSASSYRRSFSPPWPFCDGNGPRPVSVITARTPDSPFRERARRSRTEAI